jgi:hypothetical protein
MPYLIAKVPGGFKVITKATGETHSKKPLTKKVAEAQRRAIYASERLIDTAK